jgi:hypothetical protein
MRVAFQVVSVRVRDATYLGMAFIMSAKSPSRPDHASANPSYVTRPSNMASADAYSFAE